MDVLELAADGARLGPRQMIQSWHGRPRQAEERNVLVADRDQRPAGERNDQQQDVEQPVAGAGQHPLP